MGMELAGIGMFPCLKVMKRRKYRLPVPQHEFGFARDAFILIAETGLDGERYACESAESDRARRNAWQPRPHFLPPITLVIEDPHPTRAAGLAPFQSVLPDWGLASPPSTVARGSCPLDDCLLLALACPPVPPISRPPGGWRFLVKPFRTWMK
jgi:hypothetical protein